MEIITDRDQDQYWRSVRYRDGHDPIARAYAAPKLRYIERFVAMQGASILDVGCGTGVFTRLFADLTPHVVGLDYSEYMVGLNPWPRRLRARAEHLPFPSDSFDVAFVANLLHHTTEPGRVVAELARVTRRHVVLIEPNRLNPVMLLFSLLVREERGGLRSSRGFLSGLLRACGLHVVRCRAMGMISQNNTPAWLVPVLRVFDREIWWGEYLVAVASQAKGIEGGIGCAPAAHTSL